MNLADRIRDHIRRNYPDREPPAFVHDSPCEHCPSTRRPRDPEAENLLASGNAEWIRSSEFACAWRPEKLCRGNHDDIEQAIAMLTEGDSP